MEQTQIAAPAPRGAERPRGADCAPQPARAKAPAQSDDGATTATAGGFPALLAALAPPAGDRAGPDLAGSAAVGAALDGGPGQAPDGAAIAAWQALFFGQCAADGAAARAVGTASDPPGAPNGQSALATGFARIGKAQGLVAETARIDGAADLTSAAPQRAPGSTPRGAAQMLAAQRAAQSLATGLTPGAGATPAWRAPQAAQQLSGADCASAAPWETGESLALDTWVAVHPAQAEPTGPSPLPLPPLSPLPMGARSQALPNAAAQAMARAPDVDTGRSAAATDTGAASAWPGAGVADDAALYSAPQQQRADRQALADQIAWRIDHDNQSAELTVQPDGQPLQVSLSLSGKQAHVAFRSDQAQTRELLDQGMAQLGDLLRSQGLELAGMSVDTAAGDGGAASADANPGGAGARSDQTVARLPADRPARGTAAGVHAIDLFV